MGRKIHIVTDLKQKKVVDRNYYEMYNGEEFGDRKM